jgi:polysaccharide export outer membrane protein
METRECDVADPRSARQRSLFSYSPQPLSLMAAVICMCVVLLFTLEASRAAATEYRLQAGDVIEISVIGLPQLSQRAPVQLDGTITVPLVGTLAVEGTTIADARNWIQSAFASRLLQLHGQDGQEISRTVERDEITVSMAQYRPIWVSGGVARPGEQTFQPRMTIRQAIASAGGLQTAISAPSSGTIDTLRLQSEYVQAWLGLARQAVRAWRLRAELGEAGDFDQASIPPSPISDETLSRMLSMESEIQRVRRIDVERERAFLVSAAELAEEQAASLSEQLAIETQGAEDDETEYKRTQELLKKGRTTNNRVVESRRSVLYSATRKLQTANDLMGVRRRLSEYKREIEKIDDQRRMSILEELQKAEADMAAERVRLGGIDDRLLVVGMSISGAVDRRPNPATTVIRQTVDGPVEFSVGLDDELVPGDVLEVVLRIESASRAPLSNATHSEMRTELRETN